MFSLGHVECEGEDMFTRQGVGMECKDQPTLPRAGVTGYGLSTG